MPKRQNKRLQPWRALDTKYPQPSNHDFCTTQTASLETKGTMKQPAVYGYLIAQAKINPNNTSPQKENVYKADIMRQVDPPLTLFTCRRLAS